MELFLSAISLGILGSMHCVGMCGPLALALPIHTQSPAMKIWSILLYNSGRALTYSAFGFVFGLLGQGFAIFGLQQKLSITLGIIILITVFLPKLLSFSLVITVKLHSVLNKIKSLMSSYMSKRGMFSFLSIGLLNGLLPCGLVYMALTGATATGNSIEGAMFMAVFGLGTIPVMFSLMWFGNLMSLQLRGKIRKAFPYFISVIGIMMILRGMNLGIPYLSPKMEAGEKNISCHTDTKNCCHKK
jgi:uncharacterized protein